MKVFGDVFLFKKWHTRAAADTVILHGLISLHFCFPMPVGIVESDDAFKTLLPLKINQ